MKKGIITSIVILMAVAVAAIILSSCSIQVKRTETFFAMDTVVQSTAVGENNTVCDEVNVKIKEICEETERQISKTMEESDIYKLNKSYREGTVADISGDTADLLKTAKYLKEVTNGAYEPALGEIIDLWGINNGNDVLPQKVDFYSALDKNKDYTIQSVSDETDGGKEIVVSDSGEAISLDLGGIGKGYVLDKINKYLKGEKISGVLVSFGSSVLAAGKNKGDDIWSIGIKNPLDPNNICLAIGAVNKVISVSGGYERYIEIDGIRYCHIIDPETGYPVDNDLLCVVVIIDSGIENSGAISDGLSTALYVMGKQGALDFYARGEIDFEMILFVKAETEKGYDIISTNVIFSEIGQESVRALP